MTTFLKSVLISLLALSSATVFATDNTFIDICPAANTVSAAKLSTGYMWQTSRDYYPLTNNIKPGEITFARAEIASHDGQQEKLFCSYEVKNASTVEGVLRFERVLPLGTEVIPVDHSRWGPDENNENNALVCSGSEKDCVFQINHTKGLKSVLANPVAADLPIGSDPQQICADALGKIEAKIKELQEAYNQNPNPKTATLLQQVLQHREAINQMCNAFTNPSIPPNGGLLEPW